jgi:putative modified peptide
MANNAKPLAANVVASLLDKLGSDDAFRDLFQKNPAEALRQVGAPDPEHCALCMKAPKLASKEAIKGANKQLTAQLTATLAQQPITLVAR